MFTILFSLRKKHLLEKNEFYSQSVIGLHVCHNQKILVNNADDHKQICFIYKRLFIFPSGGCMCVWSGAI
jgi:hypothetical protein